MQKPLKNQIKNTALKLIDLYQKHPHQQQCNFLPTCSEYTKQAVIKYGVFKGSFLGLWRVLRCHPFRKITIDVLK